MLQKNILLIDDDEDDQEIFLSALESASATATCNTLSDAAEALQKLKDRKIMADMIFLDINMPVMTGQQFLIESRKYRELMNIPVIAFSTSSNASTIREMMDLGATDFFTKPDRFDDLISLLKSVLNRSF